MDDRRVTESAVRWAARMGAVAFAVGWALMVLGQLVTCATLLGFRHLLSVDVLVYEGIAWLLLGLLWLALTIPAHLLLAAVVGAAEGIVRARGKCPPENLRPNLLLAAWPLLFLLGAAVWLLFQALHLTEHA